MAVSGSFPQVGILACWMVALILVGNVYSLKMLVYAKIGVMFVFGSLMFLEFALAFVFLTHLRCGVSVFIHSLDYVVLEFSL